MTKPYDIVVLGGGVGGYTAAIRAAQLNFSVALVEKAELGGTCLHRGCIPTKALLRSAEIYAQAKEGADYGVFASEVRLDFTRVQIRKTEIVERLHKGVQFLMKKNKIDVYKGEGRLMGPSIFSPRSGSVALVTEDGEAVNLVPGHLILATGSKPRMLPGLAAGGRIMTSDEALRMEDLPKSIVIVGGGVIGVEWASLLRDFGVEVTVVEFEKRLIPTEDEEISKELERLFTKQGIKVLTGAKVLAETVSQSEQSVKLQVERNGVIQDLEAEKMLVSVGRMAVTEGLGLENTDIIVDRGFIKTDDFMQTMESHIFAVGDVNGKMQLAHAAAHQGIAAVERIAGLNTHAFAAQLVPRAIYTRTEVASVGWTEKQAAEKGFKVKTGKVSFRALGKALVLGNSDGFVKVVADAATGDILGVHMIGPHATDLISEASLAQVLNATPWEVGQTIHPHPTLSEALGEAMLAVDGASLNM
ncbi:dihydrolipoyl dehydrogenase [Gorillibacterium massiliense]|uniref:dihydrolipoyl dehydrogenase n=1 Tax=Gorillibacterium massiliense TaxID=1280390 RepID=UPI0004AD3204|nr:dihydrolipoyl dehydrogenase [Gorillibacterium massiliense]